MDPLVDNQSTNNNDMIDEFDTISYDENQNNLSNMSSDFNQQSFLNSQNNTIQQPVNVQEPVNIQEPVNTQKPVNIQQSVNIQQPVNIQSVNMQPVNIQPIPTNLDNQQHIQHNVQEPSTIISSAYVKDVDTPVDYNSVNTFSYDSSNEDTNVFNFDPNDEAFDINGSELNSAFMAPLPPGVDPNTIDFKQSNNDNYSAKDYLPKQINDEWFETDFSLAKYQLNDDKLINTERYIIGINTVGQSLKNASYDIRGTIPNPKFVVSPWNQSTYETDFNLKPLC